MHLLATLFHSLSVQDLLQGFTSCVPRKVSRFDKKLSKCLVRVAETFRLRKAGVPWPNPEFVGVS